MAQPFFKTPFLHNYMDLTVCNIGKNIFFRYLDNNILCILYNFISNDAAFFSYFYLIMAAVIQLGKSP